MRTMFSFAVVVGVTVFATAQTASAPKSNWLADSVTRTGSVLQLDGQVKIAACGVITADHAVGGPNAAETAISGNVRLRVTEGVGPLR